MSFQSRSIPIDAATLTILLDLDRVSLSRLDYKVACEHLLLLHRYRTWFRATQPCSEYSLTPSDLTSVRVSSANRQQEPVELCPQQLQCQVDAATVQKKSLHNNLQSKSKPNVNQLYCIYRHVSTFFTFSHPPILIIAYQTHLLMLLGIVCYLIIIILTCCAKFRKLILAQNRTLVSNPNYSLS